MDLEVVTQSTRPLQGTLIYLTFQIFHSKPKENALLEKIVVPKQTEELLIIHWLIKAVFKMQPSS